MTLSTCALNISVPVYYTMHQHNRTLNSTGLCDFLPKQNRQIKTSLKMSTSLWSAVGKSQYQIKLALVRPDESLDVMELGLISHRKPATEQNQV